MSFDETNYQLYTLNVQCKSIMIMLPSFVEQNEQNAGGQNYDDIISS